MFQVFVFPDQNVYSFLHFVVGGVIIIFKICSEVRKKLKLNKCISSEYDKLQNRQKLVQNSGNEHGIGQKYVKWIDF